MIRQSIFIFVFLDDQPEICNTVCIPRNIIGVVAINQAVGSLSATDLFVKHVMGETWSCLGDG